MKLVTFSYQDQERIGAVDEAGHIVDLHRAYARYLIEAERDPGGAKLAPAVLGRDMSEFLKGGEKSLHAARKALEFATRDAPQSNTGIQLNPSVLTNICTTSSCMSGPPGALRRS